MPAERTHDDRELSVVGLGLFALALLASLAVAAVVSDRLLDLLGGEAPPAPAQELPPAPRLDPDPAASLAALRAREEARLTSHAWVDEEAGLARVPIERAMELLVEGGR